MSSSCGLSFHCALTAVDGVLYRPGSCRFLPISLLTLVETHDPSSCSISIRRQCNDYYLARLDAHCVMIPHVRLSHVGGELDVGDIFVQEEDAIFNGHKTPAVTRMRWRAVACVGQLGCMLSAMPSVAGGMASNVSRERPLIQLEPPTTPRSKPAALQVTPS